MSLRRLFAVLSPLAVTVTAALAFSGSAAAGADVLHLSMREPVEGTFFNICDLDAGPDSPTFTASGFFQQQATIVQISELHYAVNMHGVTHLTGTYPDGRNVIFSATFNYSGTINVDPSSFEDGELKLASALVATSTQKEVIQVAGENGAPTRTSMPSSTRRSRPTCGSCPRSSSTATVVSRHHAPCAEAGTARLRTQCAQSSSKTVKARSKRPFGPAT